MKTLFVGINARYIHVNSALYSLRVSAKSYAERLGIDIGTIAIREYTIQQGAEAIYYSLLREQPDVVAFSVYIWNGPLVRDLCRDLRRAKPGIRILLGGPEVSYGVEHTGIDAYDYVIEGEGERACFALLATLAQPGCAIPDEWRFTIEGRRVWSAPIEHLEEIPFLYEGLTEELQNRILYYEASRGCPFHCSYCLSAAEEGVRMRSIETVLRELTYLTEHKVGLIKFVDRTFNCHPERSQRILAWIRTLPAEVPTCFHLEIEADKLTDELIAAMQELPPGRIQVEIGIQSTSAKTLQACRRTPTVDRCFTHIRELLANGNLHVHVDLIAGLPEEDLARFTQSFDEGYRLGAHELQLGFLKRLQGTPLSEEAEQYGYVFSPHPPYEILRSDILSAEDLWELKKVEGVLERYYNSGHFVHFLQEAEKAYESPFVMWQELAAFYDERELTFASLGVVELYRLAAEWSRGRVSEELLKKALLLDYYGYTPSDALPEGLEHTGRRPAQYKERAAIILRALGDRSRRYMVRFLEEEPVILDYTDKDPVTGRYPQVAMPQIPAAFL